MTDTSSTNIYFHYADSIQLNITDNDSRIVFSLGDGTGNNSKFTQHVGVVMTPRTLKLLSLVLTSAIKNHEEKVGVINIPQDRIDFIEAQFKSQLKNKATA